MIGKSFAHYEIVEQVGAGGMGAVYRARDKRLDRDVAIKVIPAAMAQDAERIARFQREAKTLASLQHPNIGAIYGFEDIDDVRFLVMELVEGKDLAAHLENGPLPEEDAIEIIRQVAAGLNEAHRNGIIHRDLKPANIMLTSEGVVKVLDFGLARANTSDSESLNDPGLSPTITAAMTQAGTILGTAAYMAPEQARGKNVNHRADIWALGTIFYELLTGRRLFVGETTTDVLASVIKIAPDLNDLPAETSPSVRKMLNRCLQRDPRRRLDSAADAILELDEEVADQAAAPEPTGRRIAPWIPVGISLLILAFAWFNKGSEPQPGFRQEYDLTLPEHTESDFGYSPIVSPDGRWVAVSLRDSMRTLQILLHSLETGTHSYVNNSTDGAWPFWSPDSRYLGFFTSGAMKKLHLESGVVSVVTQEVGFSPRGGAWLDDGRILFAPGTNTGIMLIDANGGTTSRVTTVDSTMVDGSHRWPQALPDGKHFIFTQWSNVQSGRSQKGGIYLGSLDETEPRELLRDISGSFFSPHGKLFFYRSGKLMAVDLDAAAGKVTNEPQVVAESFLFRSTSGYLGASVNAKGDVFYNPANYDTDFQLMRVGRDGEATPGLSVETSLVVGLALSPDGNRYSIGLLSNEGSVQIWVGDMSRNSQARLSRFDNDCWGTTFSPDGKEVMYGVQSDKGGLLYRHQVSGAQPAEIVAEFSSYVEYKNAGHWFTTDQALISRPDETTGVQTIRLLDMNTKEITPILVNNFDQLDPRLSPDEKWLAYVSNESGSPEIFIRDWPDLKNKWQVSREGGTSPHWNQAGTEILFSASKHREIRGVDFSVVNGKPILSLVKVVTPLRRGTRFIAHSVDHQEYLAGALADEMTTLPIRVLLNWDAGKK